MLNIYALYFFFKKFIIIPLIIYLFLKLCNRNENIEKNRDKYILNKKRYKLIFSLIISISFLYYFLPCWGYSLSFALSGNAMTPAEIDRYKYDPWVVNENSTLKDPVPRKIEACMTQKDLSKDISIMKEISKYRKISYIDYRVKNGQCEDIKIKNYKKLQFNELSFTENYKIRNFSSGIYVISNQDANIKKLDFKYSNKQNIILALKNKKDIKNISLELEGIEKIKKITFIFEDKGDYYYKFKYNITKNKELKNFLKDWGWLDPDGYYGKKYTKRINLEKYKYYQDKKIN